MIGNDIVDLNLAKTQSNWQRKGFLDKIFTEREQQIIKNAKNSFTTVWLLWSMKESAYKIFSRQNNIRFFAPKKFECEINWGQPTVQINNEIYFTTSSISIDSIHTIAHLTAKNTIITNCFKLENDSYEVQHKTTYNYLKNEVSKQLHIPVTQFKIEKDKNGIPNINYLGVTSSGVEKSSISISHHGVFGAYAFIK